jgi:ATP-binding cassette, subfamily B, bacterial
MIDDLVKLAWPLERLGEALEALSSRSKLSNQSTEVPSQPEDAGAPDDETFERWIRATANRLNIEVESLFCSYGELEQLVMAGGPALLRLRLNDKTCFLSLLGRGRRTVSILDPQLRKRRIKASAICSAIRSKLEAPLYSELEILLGRVGIPRRKRARACKAILRERLSSAPLDGFWLLRLSPATPFARQVRYSLAVPQVIGIAGAHATQYALWILAWWVVGRGALEGRLDSAWLIAWMLLLITIIPLRLLTTWLQGVLAIKIGGLLKQRLLYGALRLEVEDIRREGSGQLLGRIIETEAVESLGLSGGFLVLTSGIELVMASLVLNAGGGGWLHALTLLAWTGTTAFFAWRFFRKRTRWTEVRMGITNDLVERMVGHRTRLAQEPRERWHETEDHLLEQYFSSSKDMDKTWVLLLAVVPRGWLVIGILGLAPTLIWGGSSTTALAVGLGGVLLAYTALRRLSESFSKLADAMIAWKQVAPLFHAGSELAPQPVPTLAHSLGLSALREGEVAIDARDLGFRYRNRSEQSIKGCNLRILAGDKLLLEGPSGSGKSTLASLLAGLRQPDSGLLLVRGFDRPTLGDENWRRLVVSAPQFHENHTMAETFLFNLLMGRDWPPSAADLEEGEAVCRELGLGELIDRMPAGLFQMIGDTGWQLSHGERSRLYMARAIMRHADLVVLDESFAALDPENLRLSLTCVLNRVPTLVVVAHP